MNNKWAFIAAFSGIWGLVGVVFFIVGRAILKRRRKREINCTSQTYGKVVDLVRRESRDSDGNYSSSWHPVFEYRIGGLTFVKESSFGRSQAKFAIGQNVEIYYNPEDYNEFYVPGETTPKLIGTVFTAVGAVAILVAVVAAVIALKLDI